MKKITCIFTLMYVATIILIGCSNDSSTASPDFENMV